VPDEASRLTGGILLAGGSTDQDSAMKWFLGKAQGGDVIVFRNAKNSTSTSDYPTADAYNPYLYSQLGVKVDSVETIFLNSRNVANNAEVAQKVKNAEAVFFSGGDQAFYYYNIQGTLLHDALDYLINEKKAVIGGTSAGCAIQGEYGFSADFDTITTADALRNPFDQRVTIRKLLDHKYLKNTITDTHYNNPDRRGRHVTFMARIYTDYLKNTNELVKGIGVEERTAVAVDYDGKAYVFGSNNAYFIQQSYVNDYPEECVPGKPLDWYRNRKALFVYRIKGNNFGDRYFDLSNWNKWSGGSIQYFYVDRGLFGTA
jgi:cyanophycinase